MSDSKPRTFAQGIESVAKRVEQRFLASQRVLSFDEYFELWAKKPVPQSRDASRYLRDVFDHYGKEDVVHPWGTFTRFRLFDLPWEADRHGALIGQEHVQDEIYRALSNFAREGRPSRLVLLHGPNGSAKSTIVACMFRALEDYSQKDEGALYRYNWVFPSSKTLRGNLGFNKDENPATPPQTSYAHLGDDHLDSKLALEVRDHPLFLIPIPERRELLDRAFEEARETDASVEPPCEWIYKGQLSHKSQRVFEALLASYKGSYTEVLKHVQVERYFISQRYRTGAVTIGPQMSVDAGERQVTADRSLSALPPSLQSMPLYEATGELIDAAGGLLEFSDLLKRPLDTYKYLQLTVETGEVALSQQNVQLNCVMVGSANEVHLDAFREHPEFASFRGRLELVRMPYLRSYVEEQRIYDTHVAPQVRRHVAPHATMVAAMFAVLTRMRKPTVDHYGRSMQAPLSALTAIEKLDLYATGRVPERLDADAQKTLRANIRAVHDESDAYPIYEGRVGASPREMRVAILDAAQSPKYRCLSPLAVMEEIEQLCERKAEFEWLQQEPLGGGYHDTKQFQESLMNRLLDTWEHELYRASGLVDEAQYGELFDRYVQHVSVWVKKERIRNKLTGDYEEPDEKLMKEVERMLDLKGEPKDTRAAMLSAVAAWALDHPGNKVDPAVVFPHYLKRIRDTIFGEKRASVAGRARDIVIFVREEGAGLEGERRRDAEATVKRMIEQFGYCQSCAADAASTTLRRRMGDLVV